MGAVPGDAQWAPWSFSFSSRGVGTLRVQPTVLAAKCGFKLISTDSKPLAPGPAPSNCASLAPHLTLNTGQSRAQLTFYRRLFARHTFQQRATISGIHSEQRSVLSTCTDELTWNNSSRNPVITGWRTKKTGEQEKWDKERKGEGSDQGRGKARRKKSEGKGKSVNSSSFPGGLAMEQGGQTLQGRLTKR